MEQLVSDSGQVLDVSVQLVTMVKDVVSSPGPLLYISMYQATACQ